MLACCCCWAVLPSALCDQRAVLADVSLKAAMSSAPAAALERRREAGGVALLVGVDGSGIVSTIEAERWTARTEDEIDGRPSKLLSGAGLGRSAGCGVGGRE